MNSENPENDKLKFSRRDVLAGLVSLPVLGVIGYGLMKHHESKKKLGSGLIRNIKPIIPAGIPSLVEGKTINIGMVGCGGRGGYLMKALGFVHPDRIDEFTEKANNNKYWADYLKEFNAQENLNIKITAICDVFEKNARRAIEIGAMPFATAKKARWKRHPNDT